MVRKVLQEEIHRYERYFQDPNHPSEILRPPMTGTACENLRAALRMIGYEIEHSDHYDSALVNTVLRFQKDNKHRSLDGYCGPGTRKLLIEKLLQAFDPAIFQRLREPERTASRNVRSRDYIFVSYKREDWNKIKSCLQLLSNWGYETWYDKEGIPGGAEWDALIEEKVSNCTILLVFLSQLSAESKWVRREVKFADAQNKPIITIILERSELKYGLKMLLSQYQMISAIDPDFPDQLRKAIEYVKAMNF